MSKSILNDIQIASLVIANDFIEPYEESQIRKVDNNKVISYGQSSYGYDVRLSDVFAIPVKQDKVVDPKDSSSISSAFEEVRVGTFIDLPPQGFILGHTVEYFRVPENIFGVCIGKSTYARLGLDILVSPLEPGFNGHVVIEITNNTPNTVRIYANEGICQFIFFEGEPPTLTYDDRPNNYQNQQGVKLAQI